MLIRIVFETLTDFMNVSASLVRKISLNKLVYPVQSNQVSDRAFGQIRPIGYKHLVCLFDNCSVAPTEMSGGARL